MNKHIKFIPCLLEASFEAEGSIGIAITDQLYIDFSLPNNFDNAFEELIGEIKAIEAKAQADPGELKSLLRYPMTNSKSTLCRSGLLIWHIDHLFSLSVLVTLLRQSDLPGENH